MLAKAMCCINIVYLGDKIHDDLGNPEEAYIATTVWYGIIVTNSKCVHFKSNKIPEDSEKYILKIE